MNLSDIALSLLAGFGGTSIAAAVFAKGMGRIVADRLSQQWKLQNDRILELLRSDISRQEQLLAAALSSRSSDSNAAQERRLHAIDTLWENVLRMRKVTALTLFPYQILIPSEYATVFNDPFWAGVPTTVEAVRQLELGDDSVERLRPFLRPRLWMAYYLYRAVLARATFRVAMAKEKGLPLPAWHQDDDGRPEHVVTFARYVLTEEQIQSAVAKTFFGLQTLIDLMEQEILTEMDHHLSGKAAADLTISEGLRFAEGIAKARANTVP